MSPQFCINRNSGTVPAMLLVLLSNCFDTSASACEQQQEIVPAVHYAQNKQHESTPQVKKQVPLKDILNDLAEHHQVTLNYLGKTVSGIYTVPPAGNAFNGNFRENLNKFLAPFGLVCEQSGKEQYIIYKEEKSAPDKDYPTQGTRTPIGGITLPPLRSPAVSIQQQTVSGQVTDQSGDPLPGVSVLLRGTRNGTSTDQEGRYVLGDVPGEGVLVFNLMGFQTLEVPVEGQEQVDVTLEPDVSALDEVVIVGYGSVRKSDLTGSVTSVRAEDFNKGVNTTVEQLIQGKVAGAQIVTNSGEPGAGLSVNIRGASSVNAGTQPLFVIDGLPVENSNAVAGSGRGFPAVRSARSPLNVLNTSDIESIEVLKDASATAIYGARGANGVILITTKKGQEGKAQVSYDGYAGIQDAINKLPMLNSQEYQRVVNDIIADGGGPEEQRVDEITGGGTDWQESVSNRNALIHNHNISISGGTKASRYFASFNHQDQDGVITGSSFKKYTARFNLDSEVSDRLTLDMNFTAAYTRDDFLPEGYAINEGGGALYTAIYFDPTAPVRDGGGSYFVSPYLTIENPLALAEGKTAHANNYSVMGTVSGEYKITGDLSAKLRLGGDASNQRRDSYISKITQQGFANGGIATIQEGQQSNYLVEASATYQKTFQDHYLNVFAGATTQKFTTTRSNQSANDFVTEVTQTNNIGQGDQETFQMGSDKFNNKLISFIGRVNYTLKDKYLLTATFRADGSSRFGDNNKFGYFPSFAAAWKISDEDFLQDNGWLDNLKLRGSWGRTGNQNIGNFQSMSTFQPGSPANFNQRIVASLSPARIPNPDLKWETTEQWDLGLDFGLVKGRLDGSIDYYRKKTLDMLLALPVPLETGFETTMTNIGRIDNSGIDFMLNSVNIASADFSWSTTATFSTMHNEVKDLGGIPRIITGGAGFTNQIFMIREGAPLRSFYGWQIDGVWQEDDDFSITNDNVQPGDLKYRDTNGDQTVNDADRVILGDGFPSFTYSLGNSFTYKGVNLDVFIEGVEGVDMLNNNLVDTYFPIQLRRNKLAEPYLNRWTPENPSDRYPSFVNPAGQGRKAVNSYTVEDASYFRLKSIRLGYTFPPPRSHQVFQSLTIYLTGENLVTLTNYSGIDPGVNSNGTANTNIDFNTYPLPVTFMAGVQVGF